MSDSSNSVPLTKRQNEILIAMLEDRAALYEVTAVYHCDGDEESAELEAYVATLSFGFHDYMDGLIADVPNGVEAMRIALELRELQKALEKSA